MHVDLTSLDLQKRPDKTLAWCRPAKKKALGLQEAELRRQLETIRKDIECANEAQYLQGLERSAKHDELYGLLTNPLVEAEEDGAAQSPMQNEGPVEALSILEERVDLKGIKAEGSGREILLQAFNWESHRQNWWQFISKQAQRFADLGITLIWLPPPTASVSAQGYMPLDLYDLNSAYGSEEDLKRCIEAMQGVGLKVLCDAVINHRCASAQDSKGIWNRFGGRMDWDARAIIGDDRNFGGRGSRGSGELFSAAPNIDHAQEFVKSDILEWMQWMRQHIGYDGWRFDFAKGFSGRHVADYVAATSPCFAVGEFWDSLAYDGSVPKRNQDAHRQRTVSWLNAAQGGATAFDVTTKGILHAVFERTEYWRLKDAKGKPPGLMGWWPSKAVTFLENHDTGHWRFPSRHLEEGHVYMLTHPATPSIFLDHVDDPQLEAVIKRLIAIRKQAGIHCRSKVEILKAERSVYAAVIDDALLMTIGAGRFSPPENHWIEEASGKRWRIWLSNR